MNEVIHSHYILIFYLPYQESHLQCKVGWRWWHLVRHSGDLAKHILVQWMNEWMNTTLRKAGTKYCLITLIPSSPIHRVMLYFWEGEGGGWLQSKTKLCLDLKYEFSTRTNIMCLVESHSLYCQTQVYRLRLLKLCRKANAELAS